MGSEKQAAAIDPAVAFSYVSTAETSTRERAESSNESNDVRKRGSKVGALVKIFEEFAKKEEHTSK